MQTKNSILIVCGIVLLSGCTYKAELVSQKDNSIHYGTFNDFSDTFDITIRDENYKGHWSRIKTSSYGTAMVGNSTALISGSSTSGGILKQRGSKGGYLSCTFTLNNSVEYGTCEERKNKETFDLTIE
ncbi:hypothetical protein WCX49_04885 [Sulfurimonas sp. HSL-1656]|uniref:hypothetical protein n=1 Tax=Thiomicrolovo subterrani TaxID=3131934 RepID=UPI0031FA0941